MLSGKGKLALFLILIAGFSYWVLDKLTDEDITESNRSTYFPDYYLENFTTLIMDQEGMPKNKLNSRYMAHYPEDDANELHELELEIFRQKQQPIIISANKGLVTSNNTVILLNGNVYLHQNDESGVPIFEVITESARLLVDQEYAETDKPVTLITKRQVTNSIGMRAYMQDQRVEFLHNVQTIIQPKNSP